MVNPAAIYVDGNHGLGDNFFQRPAVKAKAATCNTFYLATCWPWVYHDIPNIKFVDPKTIYRTQKVHIASLPEETWVDAPEDLTPIVTGYGVREFKKRITPVQAYGKCLGIKPVEATLELRPEWLESALELLTFYGLKPYQFSLVHQPSIRAEWECPTRCPDLQYLQDVIDTRKDFPWISFGFLKENEEWLYGEPLERCTLEIHNGELAITTVAALIHLAKRVLTGVCYMLPMAQALGAGPKTLIIFGGGVAAYNLLDPLLGEFPLCVEPSPFCLCYQMDHPCNRKITNQDFQDIVREFV